MIQNQTKRYFERTKKVGISDSTSERNQKHKNTNGPYIKKSQKEFPIFLSSSQVKARKRDRELEIFGKGKN